MYSERQMLSFALNVSFRELEMAIVNVDATTTNKLQTRKPIPDGEYTFEIANDLVVTQAKPPSTNKLIKVELRVQDDGEHMGALVYDNIVLTRKAEFKLCHIVLAAGTQTKEEMESGVDLDLLKGEIVKAMVSLEPPRRDSVTGQMYDESNSVKRYIFDAEEVAV